MRTAQLYSVVLALVAAGCAGGDGTQGSGSTLSSENDGAAGSGRGGPPDLFIPDGGVLDCVPGDTGEIHVVFACDAITVYTCKDLSNIVLELADGQHVRFMGVNGQVNTFVAPNGDRITGVWVKSGENGSGDGPGYGERFDAPADSCDDPPGGGNGGGGGAGSGGSSGNGGNGGGGELPPDCEDNDPDTFCGEGGVGGGSGSGGGGGLGGNGGSGGSGGSGDSGSGGSGGSGDSGSGGSAGSGDAGSGGSAGNGGTPLDPCADNDPDTVCVEGGSGGGTGGDPQFCSDHPTDPACQVD